MSIGTMLKIYGGLSNLSLILRNLMKLNTVQVAMKSHFMMSAGSIVQLMSRAKDKLCSL